MHKIIVLIFILWSSLDFSCYAKEPLDSLAANLFDFLILKGELPKNVSRDIKNNIDMYFINEILGSDKSSYSEDGIYKFLCKYDEESQYNVFIKKGDFIEIYDITDISFLISKIILLSKEYPQKYDNNKILKYITEIIILYNNACKLNLRNTSLAFNFRFYTYYISLENYSQASEPSK